MKNKLLILVGIFMIFQFGFSSSCMPRGSRYEKKNGKVYFYSSLIKRANYRTFEVLDEFGLAKDKNYVYVFGRKIKGLDAKTFEVIEIEKRTFVNYYCYPKICDND